MVRIRRKETGRRRAGTITHAGRAHWPPALSALPARSRKILRLAAYNEPMGVVWMCRRNYLQGCCTVCFAVGLILGHCLDSWLLCCGGGSAMVVLGVWIIRRRA